MKKKIYHLVPLLLCLLAPLLAEEAPSNPFLIDPANPQPDRFYTEFLNMLSTLGLIVGAMLILAWVVRKFTQNRLAQVNEASSMKVLESRILSAKSTLHLIEIEGTGYVLAEHPHGVTKVGEFELESLKRN